MVVCRGCRVLAFSQAGCWEDFLWDLTLAYDYTASDGLSVDVKGGGGIQITQSAPPPDGTANQTKGAWHRTCRNGAAMPKSARTLFYATTATGLCDSRMSQSNSLTFSGCLHRPHSLNHDS